MWVKNKEKILSSLEKTGKDKKRKKFMVAILKMLTKPFLWFIVNRSQENIFKDGVLLKALGFCPTAALNRI